MSQLISELRIEHQTLSALLHETEVHGIQTVAGRDRLMAAEDLFLDHLRKENDLIYPALEKSAQKDAELSISLFRCRRDIEDVTQLAIRFFKKHAEAPVSEGLENDFDEFKKLLTIRMEREESILFGQYENIHGEPKPEKVS